MTSFTVLSTNTPLIIRKHFRSVGSGPSVSSTSLSEANERCSFLGLEKAIDHIDNGSHQAAKTFYMSMDLLMLLSVLLDLANPLGEGLKVILVISILLLKLCSGVSIALSKVVDDQPCCFFRPTCD